TVAFSPDGRLLLSVDPDGAATTRDARTGAVLRSARSPYPALPDPDARRGRPVDAVAFGPAGARAVTSRLDGPAVLWDAATGRECLHVRTDDTVRALAFGPDGRALLVAEAGAVRVHHTAP